MNKKLIIIAVFFLSGCQKAPFQISIPQSPLYSIPAEMKAWTMFKPGTWWIYKNETTGESDSTNYKYGPYFEENPCYNCPVVQNMWFFLISPFFIKFDLKGGADSNALLEVTIRSEWRIDLLTYLTLIHSDSSSNTSYNCQTYKCLGLFDNFVLNGNTFHNVIGTRVEKKNCYGDDYFIESWFARNIGLIKFRKHTSAGDTILSLIKWHTVQ